MIKNKYRPLKFIMAIHKVHNHGLKKNPIMKFNYNFQFLWKISTIAYKIMNFFIKPLSFEALEETKINELLLLIF